MKKLIGDLINDFDSLESHEQTVGKFNEMFPNAKLGKWVPTFDGIPEFEEYPHTWKVEIGEITNEDKRVIKLYEKITIVHDMRQVYPNQRQKKGRFIPVTVDGINFDGIRIAARHFCMSIDQFHRKFIKTKEGTYERRNNRLDNNATVSNGADD